MRQGESTLDSTCLWHGEINAWRKKLADADLRILAEDLDMPIRIRRQGFKIDYAPKAKVYENSPPILQDQIEQRRRNSVGTIQCLFKHLNYFLLPRDLYSWLIFPSHRALPMLSPFILLAILALYLIAWDLKLVTIHFAITLVVFGLLLIFLLLLRSKLVGSGGVKTKVSFLSVMKIAYYVLLHEYLILLAWKDFVLGTYSVAWAKVRLEKKK